MQEATSSIIPSEPPLCPTCGNPKTMSGKGKNAGWRCLPCNAANRKSSSGSLAKTRSKEIMKKYDVKTELISLHGSCCNMCGYDKHQSVLEFHHIDSTNKKFDISNRRRVNLTEEVVLEADKCILLCSNCHAYVHTQNWESPAYQKYLLGLKEKGKRRVRKWRWVKAWWPKAWFKFQ